MLTEVKQHLRLLWLYFKFNLSASMEYRGSFLLQVFGMVLNNASFIFFWWIIFGRTGSIKGYRFEDILYMWAISTAAFGFAFVVFGNIRNITNIIVNGDLDSYLLQPKDAYLNVLCSRTMISAWGDLAYGFILFVVVDGLHPLRLLLFLLFTVLGGLLMGSVIAAAETLTFFIGNASAIGRLATEFLISFTVYPESIYKGLVKWILYTLMPAGFIVFMPIKILKAFSWGNLGILLVIDSIYVLGTYALFQKGLKRYESGNLITTKL